MHPQVELLEDASHVQGRDEIMVGSLTAVRQASRIAWRSARRSTSMGVNGLSPGARCSIHGYGRRDLDPLTDLQIATKRESTISLRRRRAPTRARGISTCLPNRDSTWRSRRLLKKTTTPVLRRSTQTHSDYGHRHCDLIGLGGLLGGLATPPRSPASTRGPGCSAGFTRRAIVST